MIEVLKQMVEALEWCHGGEPIGTAEAIKVGKQAIAELESQEPVATVTSETGADITMSWWHEPALPVGTKLFTHPPQRTEQEQPLPPVEIGVDVTADGASVVAFYRRSNAVMEMFYSQFHPAPQRTWVGLTDEDKKQMAKEANYHWEMTAGEYAERIGQLTEAKLKEKNNG